MHHSLDPKEAFLRCAVAKPLARPGVEFSGDAITVALGVGIDTPNIFPGLVVLLLLVGFLCWMSPRGLGLRRDLPPTSTAWGVAVVALLACIAVIGVARAGFPDPEITAREDRYAEVSGLLSTLLAFGLFRLRSARLRGVSFTRNLPKVRPPTQNLR